MMGMHSKKHGNFTEKNKLNLYLIKEIGCLACIIEFGAASPGGVGHHAEDDNDVVLGHGDLICLCDWHHDAQTPQGYNSRSALERFGPSRHKHRVAFRERYGSDLVLLEKQRRLLAIEAGNMVRCDA